jgi:cytochrome c553
MSVVIDPMDPKDFMPLAQYFSKKPWPKLEQPHPPDDIAAVAKRVNASVVCTSCHLEGFKGDSTQPRLAGQNEAYLQKTMTDFASGARGNNPGMSGFMKGLTAQEIAAMAAWLAGM